MGVPPPKPKVEAVRTQTVFPDIWVGYAKNKNARVTRATLKIFMPVPPKTSLAKITAKAVATAIIQRGVSTGTIKGINIPVTKKPS